MNLEPQVTAMLDPAGDSCPDPNPLTETPSPDAAWRVYRGAFTVIGGILLLSLCLNMCHFDYDRGPSPDAYTNVLLRASSAVSTEYEVQTTHWIDHRSPVSVSPRNAPDRSGLAVPDSWNERCVAILFGDERCRQMVRALGSYHLMDTDDDGFLEILDAWGRPLIYTAKVSHSDAFTADDFLPECDWPAWHSAGDDGQWGDVRDPNDVFSRDNMHSYELD